MTGALKIGAPERIIQTLLFIVFLSTDKLHKHDSQVLKKYIHDCMKIYNIIHKL